MKILTALFAIFVVIALLPEGKADSSSSAYGACKRDINTQYNVQLYKQQYPNVSDRQIAHILCKDAK